MGGLFFKGAPVTLGLVNWIDNICDDDSNIVKVLKHLGAVPFVRTNLPQIMFRYGFISEFCSIISSTKSLYIYGKYTFLVSSLTIQYMVEPAILTIQILVPVVLLQGKDA